MFKITLPCSGKVTGEVDVQVLIKITGFVPADELEEAAYLEPASEVLAANSSGLAEANLMQSDEPPSNERLRLVDHTLAIKRMKICTMHPVPVPVQPKQPVQVAQAAPKQGFQMAAPAQPAPVSQARPENRWQQPAGNNAAQVQQVSGAIAHLLWLRKTTKKLFFMINRLARETLIKPSCYDFQFYLTARLLNRIVG